MAISRKAAKYPIADRQKIRTALASDFSIAMEQVLLTPALKPIFNAFGAGGFNPCNEEYCYFTQSSEGPSLSSSRKDRKDFYRF
jgi:hypothetical protein